MRKLLILALLPMLFVSCSKDDSNETPQEPDKRELQIVGKWLVTDYWWTYSGLGYADEAHWKEVHGDLTVTFIAVVLVTLLAKATRRSQQVLIRHSTFKLIFLKSIVGNGIRIILHIL